MALLAPPALLVERLDGRPDLLRLARAGTGLRQLLTVRGWSLALSDPLAVVSDLPTAARLADRLGWSEDPPDAAPPFTGGLAGLLSDDLSRGLLGIPGADRRPLPAPVPPVALGLYDTALCIDPSGDPWIVAADLPGLSRRPLRERADELRRRAAALGAEDASPAPLPPASLASPSTHRAAHAAAVARILDWIRAGDLYQLNLTLQWSAPWPHGGAALARRLWAASPDAAHAAWIGGDGWETVSASPETFLRSHGRSVVTRPIKGTRPRRQDPGRDAAEARALAASAKDHAEHVMIVDLERNDLGRVCEAGSVRVPELAALESHPTVWHLTSTVTGRLRDDVGFHELVAATFPSGSVTGAPKRMAVDRTRLVEPVRRGAYCGAIGVVSRGLVDLSVAIRTAVVRAGVAHYGAGGGIVADSKPDDEWEEVLHKAEAFFGAVNARPA